MGQIICEREKELVVENEVNFYTKDTHEIVSVYPSNEYGVVLIGKMTQQAVTNWFKDLNNDSLYHIKEKREYYITHPAIYKCDCGEEFELYNEYMGACSCPKCEKYFNLFGQALNNPETWRDGGDW